MNPDIAARPTRVRFLIVAVTSVAAMFMYVDRACLSLFGTEIMAEFAIEKWQLEWIYSAFFWSYALAQVPSGLLGPILGLRRSLAIMLFTWSACTVVCGLTTGLLGLFVARLAVGIAEAGAYPTAAALVKGWFPVHERGRASGFVALGGRLGFALTPFLAALLVDPNWLGLYFNWRGALIVFGVLGIAWSAVFWFFVRDTARQHPASNAAEAVYAGPPPAVSTSTEWPVLALISSRNMWLLGTVLFGINIGWAFLITKLVDVLKERFHADPDDAKYISSIPAWALVGGVFLGGFVGDFCVRRFGLRRGRSWPIASMLCIASLAYLACTQFENPWSVAVTLAVMAIASDIAIPSVWAFAQDVGGRYTGATIGFGNMIGNLGAATSPIALGYIQREFGWDWMFVSCSICFALAAIAALNLDATKPVMREDRPRPGASEESQH